MTVTDKMIVRDTHPLHTEITETLNAEFTAPPPEGWLEFEPDVFPRVSVKVGLISLTNDPSAEIDMHAYMAPFDDVRVSTHRVYSPQHSNMDALQAVGRDIGEAVAGLMPDDPLDVVAFGCTSASMVLGSDTVAASIREHKPNVKVTDPIQSALKALEMLGARRIALLTPYIGEVNVELADYLERQGVTVVTKGFFRSYDDEQRNRIASSSFLEAAGALASSNEVDALFISCTALQTASVIRCLEEETGKPVVTSNQALAWNVMRLGGHSGTTDRFGKLFTI